MKMKIKIKEYSNVLSDILEQLRDKGVMTKKEIGDKLAALTELEKKKLYEQLASSVYVSKKEDVYEYTTPKESDEDDEIIKTFLSFQKIEVNPDNIKVATSYNKGTVAIGFADFIKNDFLIPVLRSNDDIDVVIDVEPGSKLDVYEFYNTRIKEIENRIYEYNQLGYENEELLHLKQKYEKYLDELSTPKNRIFNLNLSFYLKSNNAEDLKNLSEKLNTLMNSSKLTVKTAINFQLSLLKSVIPLGINYIPKKQFRVTNKLLAQNFPFIED